MFNTTRPTECGVGAVVNWADHLWAVTYSPYHPRGSTDKLFQIDDSYRIFVHPESVGGTPANRMIHEESGQLLIGPYLIDKERNIRVIPPRGMPGRLTGTARHLTDPANKVYYATMEEDFYEADVHSLKERMTVRTAEVFLKYADWDEANKSVNADHFRQVAKYRKVAQETAETLPDFERREVILMLDEATQYLKRLITGEVS